MCYYNHSVNELPFENIGKQDITSHVNFSALDHWGRKNGLGLCGFTDQAHFLMGLGIDEYLKDLQEKSPVDYYKKMLPIKSLIMDMGETFKIMIQKPKKDVKLDYNTHRLLTADNFTCAVRGADHFTSANLTIICLTCFC